MKFLEVKIAYGWCATVHEVCPKIGFGHCAVTVKYETCESFRKVGAQSAIEETDDNGKRRIYFKTTEGLYQEAETGELVRYSPLSKEISHCGVSE